MQFVGRSVSHFTLVGGLSFGNFFEEDRRLHMVIAWVRSRHFAMQSSCSWVYNYDAVAAVETGTLGYQPKCDWSESPLWAKSGQLDVKYVTHPLMMSG